MKGPTRDNGHADCSPRQGIDRRTALRAGAAGSLMMVTLPIACGSAGGGGTVTAGPIEVGNVSTVTVGSLKAVPNELVFIGRDSGGLYAMSSICTHQGCILPAPLTSAAQQMTCGCHGSQFDRNGTVLTGPAQTSLQHYEVDLAANGTITIQGDKPVSSGARTPVT
jgi:nitrite reductase/ring-hydroxylating ferredoxin subunit